MFVAKENFLRQPHLYYVPLVINELMTPSMNHEAKATTSQVIDIVLETKNAYERRHDHSIGPDQFIWLY